MRIGFGSGWHGVGPEDPQCGYPFDNEWGVLAHAFYPGYNTMDGDLHFDYNEAWTFAAQSSKYSGPDLMQVGFHELGHALGLPHNSYRQSIMYPTYAWKEWKCKKTDKECIKDENRGKFVVNGLYKIGL